MLYLEFIKKAFQERFAYRFDFYIRLIGSFLVLFVQISVWQALFRNQADIQGVSLAEMLTYVIIASVVMCVTGSNAAHTIAERVQTGSIGGDLLRPVYFKYYIFAEDLGVNSFRLLYVVAPASIVMAFFYGFLPPSGWETGIYFFVTMFLGILLSLYIHFILGLFAFWLQTSWYVEWYLRAFRELFSGSFVPLWFYPEWLLGISVWLPFRYIYFDPISIYLGKYGSGQMLRVLALQLVWLLILWAVERLVWHQAQKQLMVNGG